MRMKFCVKSKRLMIFSAGKPFSMSMRIIRAPVNLTLIKSLLQKNIKILKFFMCLIYLPFLLTPSYVDEKFRAVVAKIRITKLSWPIKIGVMGSLDF